jgi:hypothetical protein
MNKTGYKGHPNTVALRTKSPHQKAVKSENVARPDSLSTALKGQSSPARNSKVDAPFPIWPCLFVISLCFPFIFFLGSLRMSPYRFVLLIAFLPAFFKWISGGYGKPTTIDFCFLFASIWGVISLFVTTNFDDAIKTAGIYFIETFGSYLLGRAFIRNYAQFQKFARVMFGVLLALLPFAIFETLASKNILLELLSKIGNVPPPINVGSRMGLYRAQVVFDNPILWGIFAASLLGVSIYTLGFGKSFFGRSLYGIGVGIATVSSMSSGALVSYFTQTITMIWDKITAKIKNRWRILGLIFTALYIAVDSVATHTPVEVFISYLTFSKATSFMRVLIWKYGTASVWENPFFGIGLGEWERPRFMGPSMDNFWLVTAVRYGFPTFLFFIVGIYLLARRMSKVKILDGGVAAARAGLLTTYLGLIVAGCTVHYWNAMYCWVLFLFGCGYWVLQYEADANQETSVEAPADSVVPTPKRKTRIALSSSQPEQDKRKWLR